MIFLNQSCFSPRSFSPQKQKWLLTNTAIDTNPTSIRDAEFLILSERSRDTPHAYVCLTHKDFRLAEPRMMWYRKRIIVYSCIN